MSINDRKVALRKMEEPVKRQLVEFLTTKTSLTADEVDTDGALLCRVPKYRDKVKRALMEANDLDALQLYLDLVALQAVARELAHMDVKFEPYKLLT